METAKTLENGYMLRMLAMQFGKQFYQRQNFITYRWRISPTIGK
jgi:hypothetical protein